MNKIYIQKWEDVYKGDVYESGCTIHLNMEDVIEYKKNYKGKLKPISCSISGYIGNNAYKVIKEKGFIRINESSFRNMVEMGDIKSHREHI